MKFKRLNEASPSSIKKLEDLKEVCLSDLYKWGREEIDIGDDGYPLYTPDSEWWVDCTHEYRPIKNKTYFDEENWFFDYVWDNISHNLNAKNLIKGVEELLTSEAMPVKIDKNIINIYKENIDKYEDENFNNCFWILDECAKFFVYFEELSAYSCMKYVPNDYFEDYVRSWAK